jgi:hypothetical protein
LAPFFCFFGFRFLETGDIGDPLSTAIGTQVQRVPTRDVRLVRANLRARSHQW